MIDHSGKIYTFIDVNYSLNEKSRLESDKNDLEKEIDKYILTIKLLKEQIDKLGSENDKLRKKLNLISIIYDN